MVKLSDCWRTPKWLCDLLGRFDLDPCGAAWSHVQADRQFMSEVGEDGLALAWDGPDFAPASVFVNPPYSDPGPWAERLATHPGPWAALVKLDPTTRWWAALMTDADTWAPFRKRIRFDPPAAWDGPAATANFPSALVTGGGWPVPVALQPHLWLR